MNARARWLSIVLVTVVTAGSLSAVVAGGPTKWHVGGGVSLPQGQASDALDTGWVVQGGATLYPFANPQLGVRIEGGVNWFDMSGDFLREIDTDPDQEGIQAPDSGDASAWHVTGNLLWDSQFRGRWNVYVTGGIGAYYLRSSISETGYVPGYWCDWYWGICYPIIGEGKYIIDDDSTWEFGFNAAAGVTYRLNSGNELFLETAYHWVNSDGDAQYVPVTFGVRF